MSFNFSLIKNESLIYKKEEEDYLNWFPVNFEVKSNKEIVKFTSTPTLSLWSIKRFIIILNNLIYECEHKLPLWDSQFKYQTHTFGATEGEFEILFKNLNEPPESNGVNYVSVTIWINAACCVDGAGGAYKGFRFFVEINIIKELLNELNSQLYTITNGNEGCKMD